MPAECVDIIRPQVRPTPRDGLHGSASFVADVGRKERYLYLYTKSAQTFLSGCSSLGFEAGVCTTI